MTFRPAIAAAIAAVTFAAPAAASAPDPAAKLLVAHTVHAYPGQSAPTVTTVAATRPITGQPTVLPVIGRASADGRPWLRVRLPARPNGSTGWIAADGTVAARRAWTVRVDRSDRVARAYRNGRKVRSFRVVVGADATPTPTGAYFVAERVRQPAGAPTGPWALATSAHSSVLQEFAGGPGQIALHGRTGLPDPLGSAASHGCVRLDDSAIRWLAARMTAGSLVTVTP